MNWIWWSLLALSMVLGMLFVVIPFCVWVDQIDQDEQLPHHSLTRGKLWLKR